MADHFEPAVFSEVEGVVDGRYGVSAVGFLRHGLVDALHADFDAGAAVAEHLVEMRLQAVVRPRFDGDPDALADAVLAVPHGLLHAGTGMPAARIVQIPNEEVFVLPVQTHERSPHHDVLHLVHAVPQLLQLRHPPPRLRKRIVPRPDRPHAGRLVPRVSLGAVLEIAIRTAGTVRAHVPRQGDVGTAVGTAHHGHHGDAGGGADGLLEEVRGEGLAVGEGDGGEDVGDAGEAGDLVLARELALEGGEVARLAGVVVFDQRGGDTAHGEGVRGRAGRQKRLGRRIGRHGGNEGLPRAKGVVRKRN
mmetsp:Transcript_16241/g.36536  ORF Transcript_16241/g.36536 Transcript_16241/m.36536 type:complete len:305 (+) Transcript_16241:1254-2168(+)